MNMRNAGGNGLLVAAIILASAWGTDSTARPHGEDSSATAVPIAARQGPGQDEASSEADAKADAEVAAVAAMLQPFEGDLDRLVEKRYIRVLVTLSRTHYYLDKGEQHGVAYEGAKHFEEWLNKRLGSGTVKVQLAFIPVSRDRIFSALAEGRGDIAVANLTVTEQREQFADFATPWITDGSEVVVTAKDQPLVKRVEDLAGREIHVRKSSSYHASLLALNERLRAANSVPVKIVEAAESLEDEDLLEMIDAGQIPATVVDQHIASLWQQIFDGLVVHSDIRVREGAKIAWAVRKGCPKLLDAVNDFAKENKKGSLLFNMTHKKYLKSTKWVKRSTNDAEMKKFRGALELFKKYGEKYDVPWLLLGALAYQESQIDQSAKSSAGAVGVMQIKPSTAEGKPIEIRGVEESMDRNIEAGTKYLRFIADKHVNEPELDQLTRGLFVVASYNAGPTRIAKLRKQAAKMGLDPNQWFGNVEVVAAKEIGRETVQYVANIYKYYVSYKMIVDGMIARGELRAG